jgi:hypothetical protein
MLYLAVIGDIVDSKQLAARGEFQTKVAAALKTAGTRNVSLVSPYTITLGDEFQAVYKNADRLFLDIFSILRDIYPVQARFAIGVGDLSTPVNRKQALGMDGRAFYRAREAIIDLKESSFLIRAQGAPTLLGPPHFDVWQLTNHLLNLMSHKVAAWEENRLRILCGLLAGRSVGELGDELGISKVAVYKNINAAVLDEHRALCDQVAFFLNGELENNLHGDPENETP